MLLAAPALAGDYKPVTCDEGASYAGAPLASPPEVAMLPSAASAGGSFDASTTARLEAALAQALVATKASAMTVAVSRPDGATWASTRTRDGSPAPERLWWASVGKMVTAVAVLRLVEENRLSLADPISRYVAGVPNGDAVTIEHLLAHTSGLFSANEDKRVRASRRPMKLADELVVLHRHGAMFCPGERWRYSNSGYALLGAVIEKVEGRPFARAASELVLTALGPGSLRVLSPGEAATDLAPLTPADPKAVVVQPSWTGAAAGLAGRAEDMNRFLQATLAPGLLSDRTRRQRLARLYPMFDQGSFYGLGLMIYRPPGTDLYWIGHGGGSPGANAISIWSPRDQAFVSVALTGDGSAAATANLLLKALPERPRSPSVPTP
ncbi:MAG TPA: serine hydrolase domain-containing protein [Sphingomonas sp.]